jgi:hypothetical protein
MLKSVLNKDLRLRRRSSQSLFGQRASLELVKTETITQGFSSEISNVLAEIADE